MIIPFPIRIPVFPAFVFTSLLVLVQQLEHTDPRYSGLIFCFFMLSVLAFNVAGGFSRPSGGYIFFFSTLGVVVGTVYKALIGQPAQTHLQQPLLLMSAHIGIISGMLLAAFLTRIFVKTKDGMAAVLNVRSINYSESALGCLVLYFTICYLPAILPGGGGQLMHSLLLVNPFCLLSIFLGTIAVVRSSHGRSSTSVITWIGLIYLFVTGALAFSKQGMFTSFVCWLLGVAWARFHLRLPHLVFIVAFCVYAEMVITPMSTLRNQPQTSEQRVALAEHYLTHYNDLQRQTRIWEPPSDLDWRMFYYGSPHGIWDRLSMLPNDSILISFSDQGHYFGLKAIRYYFENWVPHIIDPHKLQGIQVGGNEYMHEMGLIAEDDMTTGISFSPTAEMYHIAGWFGILVVAPPIFLLLFSTVDAVCGDIRRQPWGLLSILGFAHVAPEGGISAAIMAVWLGNIGTIIAIFGCGYITPIVGLLLSGGDKERTAHAGLAPLPRQLQARALRAS